ncbi:MAG: Arm DNA-binding domain-containing protein, partial [Nitriliruptorales bacterium]
MTRGLGYPLRGRRRCDVPTLRIGRRLLVPVAALVKLLDDPQLPHPEEREAMTSEVFRRCARHGCGAILKVGAQRCHRCGGDAYSWAFRVDIGSDAKGKRRQTRRGGFASKKEAIRARRELLASVDGGRYVEPRKLTLAAYLRDEWLVATSPPAVAWKTWRERRDSFERHVITRFGGVELQKLTAAQLTALYGDLLREGGPAGQGLSPTTVRDLHRRLRKALADAVRWGLTERNPTDLADPPPAKVAASARRAAMQTWDEDELRTFLEATSGDPLGTLWLVAALTGLRRSE